MKKNTSSDAKLIRYLNAKDADTRARFHDEMLKAPIPPDELLNNASLFLDRRLIARMLFASEMYQHIVGLHGSIFEFGVRYGPNMALFASLREIYEPLNPNRKLVGFDTFAGFPSVDVKYDSGKHKPGDFAVTENYERYLERILTLHESMSPLANQKRFTLIKGDATKTVKEYLKDHPETLIALAYFDMDLYQPTRVCLEAILPYLNKGAVIAFDELNMAEWPGETVAMREILGSGRFRLIHSPFRGMASYLVYE
jgi:Methyltransferase domain